MPWEGPHNTAEELPQSKGQGSTAPSGGRAEMQENRFCRWWFILNFKLRRRQFLRRLRTALVSTSLGFSE